MTSITNDPTIDQDLDTLSDRGQDEINIDENYIQEPPLDFEEGDLGCGQPPSIPPRNRNGTETISVRSPRWQIFAKQKEVRRFIEKALKAKLIQSRQTTAWRQVHLMPKPNGKWKFCLDIESQGWLLPNIKHVLQGIGKTDAKDLAVLDLTQGYYQM